MVASCRILSLGREHRIRLSDASRNIRRNLARARSSNADCSDNFSCDIQVSEIAPCEDRNVHMNVEVQNNEQDTYCYASENTSLHNENVSHEIVYAIGDYTKVQSSCLSIHTRYPHVQIVCHPSTLPLLAGMCVLHNMGNLTYECSFCRAYAWKVEGRSIRNFVGKYCCMNGKVKLPTLLDPPPRLQALLKDDDAISKAFRKNIRAYNSALAFASLGAHVDDRLNRCGGVYSFRVHGSMYHSIGTLMPNGSQERSPKFAQLYFYDTEHELENRMQHMPSLNQGVLSDLQQMMHEHNPYAHALRSARERMHIDNHLELRMVIFESRSNGWQYIAPSGAEVAAILPGQGDEVNVGYRDIQINFHEGGLHRISNLHRSYMPLLYVLLFPRGEDGWNMFLRHNDDDRKNVTQLEYYGYRLQIRNDTIQSLLRGGRLLQQYIVDAYSSVEEGRLLWVRNNQRALRVEVYSGLADMVQANDGIQNLHGISCGRRIVLPSTFTGGPRYMYQLYQDAMAIVRKMGKPDLFITFTCNPKWQEISDALLSGQTAQDRPDVTSRVFYQKYKDMMQLFIKKALFGKVVGHVSVIEFQKRGLPHAHILLILERHHKPLESNDYDKVVCAELPDKEVFPELYDIISKCNVHGPCGVLNPKAPCMIDGKCRFKYPRNFNLVTVVDKNGYPTYMRRDDGRYVQSKDIRLDNRWIAPYNPFLSLRYKAHLNVEVCSTISAVKYLYKYVYKGHDRATVMMQDRDGPIDEINSYLDARYISASEACWRLYKFDMHEQKPDIQRLQIHLPMQNNVTFLDSDALDNVVNDENNRKTTLTEWFITNQMYPEARNLLYIDFPTKWKWNKGSKKWTIRQKGDTIGRMYTISPTAGDQFFLRTLLTVCKGCTSFEDLRTYEGHVYATYKAACLARGLLESDEEWFTCLEEAALQQSAMQLRNLFVVLLVFCEPINPGDLWERFSLDLSEDFLHTLLSHNDNVIVCQTIAKNQALANVEHLLQQHGKHLIDFTGMPQVDRSRLVLAQNSLVAEERMFDKDHEKILADQMVRSMNVGQLEAFNEVLAAVHLNEGCVFFLDGPGGSGKTYLYNAMLCRLRGEGKIALACASSGIAALLLCNGRTAHSRFKIPLELLPISTCNIKMGSQLAELMKLSSLIIWDEAPMTHRYAFEALDRTLRDVLQCDKLFGGKVLLFGGDFRQVLPVIPKASRAEIVNASLCHSYIWEHTKLLKLTQNMRILQSVHNMRENEFSQFVLNIGNGTVQGDGERDNVLLPPNMLLPHNSLEDLIGWVFKKFQNVNDWSDFFKNRCVLSPRNTEVDVINELGLSQMHGCVKEYLSADSVASIQEDGAMYTIEYLNSLNVGGGCPPHALILKENAPIILLRNLDARRGLCNGTRLICKNFYSRVIEAEIITGTNCGSRVFIPRINFIPSNLGLPFDMRRRQFPIKLAFGMTINKAQGQTLGIMGLYLPTDVFSHGQLYVAMSRVRSMNAVKVVINGQQIHEEVRNSIQQVSTLNVVYKEVLQKASRD